jgi:hypothetical protein
LDLLHRAKSGLCIKPGVCVEGSRRPFTLAVALSQLKRDFLTGLTPWIPTRTYTQNIRASNYLGGWGDSMASGILLGATAVADTLVLSHRTKG